MFFVVLDLLHANYFITILNTCFSNYNYLNWYSFYLPQIIGELPTPIYYLYSLVCLFKVCCVEVTEVITNTEFFLSLQLSTNMQNALIMSLKFLLCVSLLIFARGGIPRFRFDYLTKLGWIRFLSLVLLSFLIEIIILSIF